MTLTKIGASLGGAADTLLVTQTGHGFVSNDVGKAVKMLSTGLYDLAKADAIGNADAVGIILQRIDANTLLLALSGRITVDGCVPTGDPGTVLFLPLLATKNNNVGYLNSTEPSSAGEVSKPMAVITISGSEMILFQMRGEVITTGVIAVADGSIDNDAMADNAINTDEIVDDAVTADKLANSINSAIAANTAKVTNATHTGDVTGATALTIATGAVDIAHLSASGTKDGTTVLHGNNTFAAVAGAGTPYFHAKLTSNQNVTDNTSTQIAFHTATLDSASGFTTGASAKYTIPSGQGGKWFIKLGLEVDGGGAGTLNEGRSFIKIEGSVVAQTIMGLATNPGDIIQCICSCIYNVSADDDITFFGLVDNTTGSNTRFAGSSANNETSVIGFKIA